MTTRTLPASSLLGLALMACAPTVDTAADEEAIRSTAAHWQELDRQKDAAGIADLFAQDGAVYWEQRQPATGPDAIREFMALGFALDPSGEGSFAPDRIDVAASGDLAVEQGSWQGSGTSGRYMTLHKKIDGVWKVAGDMSLSQAPNGGAPEWAQSLLAGWYEDFNARDAASLVRRYYTADARVGEARGRAAIIARFEAGWRESNPVCSGSFSGFQVVGTVATGWGVDTCIETPADGGESRTVYSRWIGVYEQQPDGSWLTTRDIGEDIEG